MKISGCFPLSNSYSKRLLLDGQKAILEAEEAEEEECIDDDDKNDDELLEERLGNSTTTSTYKVNQLETHKDS